jgi:hypothetical protein
VAYLAVRPDAAFVLASPRDGVRDAVAVDTDVIAALASLPDARSHRLHARSRPVGSEAARVLVSVVTMSSLLVSYMLYVLLASPY